ncbi:agmatinase [Nonomuraea roseoviolacea subsp. roseoviolacea]|uniref:Agmatinase n=1 Tax=Nonomuraea roseoviolacea subsp. carminata TaxID=160689 RepID=A0ABT1KCZ8_9ACTN|nr:agmatinase [Nonomuraea roseoviolacea]MCP2351261.1 agmatinase [Nonomuraea roseoviolacea subsp. carminata]
MAVLGVPIDSGTGGRPGARFGPAAIREASALISGNLYHVGLETEVLEHLRIVDVGDVPVTPGRHEQNLDAAEKWARELMSVTDRIVVLGGDHSVLLPVLRAVADRHGPVSFVHWDAHADTWDGGPERLLTHATAVRRVIEEGLTNQVFQIGLRGYGPSRETFAWAGEHGVEHWTMMDVDETGLTDIVQQVISTVTGKVYVSIDIDVLDPSYAPGTGTPEPGGLTSRELLAGIRDLVRNTDVVGLDVVEVAPPYDHADVTALVANRCVLEFLSATAQRRATGRG